MHYTLHQLQIYVKVTQNKSITKAAEDLHLTQPAVSIQLKNFQDQFDIPLTEIVGRQLYVTEFGEEIAKHAQEIIVKMEEIDARAQSFLGELTGKLKIAVVSTGKYVLPYFLSEFILKHEKVELVMDVTNKSQVIESLEKNEVDFAFVSIVPTHLSIHQVELLHNDLYLVTSKNETFPAVHRSLNPLKKKSFIFREAGSGTRMITERYFDSHQLNIEKKLELTSNEAVKQAVIAGLGCSIMPIIGIRNELTLNDLQIIPAKGLPIRSEWTLIYHKGKKHSPVAKAFLKHLEENKERIAEKHFGWISSYPGI